MTRKYYLGYSSGPNPSYGLTIHKEKIKSNGITVSIQESKAYYKKHLIIPENIYEKLDNYLRWEFKDKAKHYIKVEVWGNKLTIKIQ